MNKKQLFNRIYLKLPFRDKILFTLFKDYTYNIFNEGIKIGYNWHN